MNAKARMANLITGTRILCSNALLFCPAFSPSFVVLYLVSGLTDMVDGAVARKTGTVSAFGARLDTAADFVFVAVCLWKLLPSLAVPLWLWIWIVLIALIKMINTISGYVIQKRYVALHTVLNKVTGVLLFLLPMTLPVAELKYSAPLVCTVATLAAIQEGHFIRTGKENRENGNEGEGVYTAELDVDMLRNYRRCEVWGFKKRRPELYGEISENNL